MRTRFAHARLEALDHFTVTQERGSFDAFYKDSRVKLSTFVALLEGEEVAERLRFEELVEPTIQQFQSMMGSRAVTFVRHPQRAK